MLTLRATIQAVGAPAVLVVGLVIFFLIARLDLQPWWMKLVLALPPAAILLAGVFWLLSGGDQGTHLEVVDGDRRLTITNVNPFARALAQAALNAFSVAPLPRPVGVVRNGSPADPSSVVAGPAALPPAVEIASAPIDVPPGAGRLP